MGNINELVLRLVNEKDCRFLYELRNEPTVRKNSFQTAEITYEQHVKWFQRKTADLNVRIYILEQNNEAVGQVRVERTGKQGEISYAVSEKVRGKGYAKWMLREVANKLLEEDFCEGLMAEVKQENIASQKIFRCLGYQEEQVEYGYCYSKKLPMFSILMCTYNSADTMEKSIDSVIFQQFTNWELIVLDNGSRDQTAELLKEYTKKDCRIRCVFREDNIGWKKGLSECLEVADGRYMMFLGADDYLATDQTLENISTEVFKHNPDIIWTSCVFAVWENGEYRIITNTSSQYRVYEKIENMSQIAEIMQSVYYNSVMHYVKIGFLKKHNIDFYEPFSGDCEGMTEALVRAEKMVVLDKVSYILTTNTSQTSTRVFYDMNTERQWESIRSVLFSDNHCSKEALAYIARRVLNNIIEVCQRIVLGEKISDSFMNPIERSMPERFSKIEEMMDNSAMEEMLYYAGREEHMECLLGAAGVAYWMCKKNDELSLQMKRNTRWLADFLEIAMEVDEKGQVIWRTHISKTAGEKLIGMLRDNKNQYCYGLELILRENVIYEDCQVKEILSEALSYYLKSIDKYGN